MSNISVQETKEQEASSNEEKFRIVRELKLLDISQISQEEPKIQQKEGENLKGSKLSPRRNVYYKDNKEKRGSEMSSPPRSIRSSKSTSSSQGFQGNTRASQLEQDGKVPDVLFEKKKIRFRIVKDWEDKRIQKSSIFQSIFKDIGDRISKIAVQSNEFIENQISFLRDMQIQFAQLAKSSAPQIEEAFKYTPHIGNVSYPPINRLLRNISNIDKNSCANMMQLSKFIDENIIRIFLLRDKKNFSNVFSSFTSVLKEKLVKIAKLDKIALDAYESYSDHFKELMQFQAKNKEYKKDFYYQELVYMHHVCDHLENLKEFGLQVVRFSEELEQLQRERLKNVHQALSLFLEKKRELVKGLENYDIVQEMVDSMKQELENTQIEISTLLLPEQENYIRLCYRKEKIDIPILKQFVSDFNLRNPADKILVIKELSALYNHQTEKSSKKKDWFDCSLILTVDNNIIVTAGMLDSFGKPICIIFLPNSKAEFSKESMVLTVVENQKHILWSKKKNYQFKLQHEFDANEITQFLSKNFQAK